jgi:hypothetical protein
VRGGGGRTIGRDAAGLRGKATGAVLARPAGLPGRAVATQLAVVAMTLAGGACGSGDDLTRPDDSVPPSITIVQPADGADLNTDQPQFVIRVSDDETGVFPGTLNVKIDGQDFSQEFLNGWDDERGEIRVSGAIRLEGGPHAMIFQISDAAGNRASATSEFRIVLPDPGEEP